MDNEQNSEPFSIEALRSGDRHELSRMVQVFSPHIYRVAMKIVGDVEDAEDVLQETFIKALVYLPKFEGRSAVGTWLYRIAINEALAVLRKRKPEISVDQEIETEDGSIEPLQIVDWCCLPEEEFGAEEVRKFMDAAIQKLPQTLKLVFILRDVEGINIKETAEILGISEANVKTRLLRARLKLREALSEYFGERLREK